MAKKKPHSVLRYIFHYDHWIIVAMALLLTWLLSLLFDALGLKNPYKKSVSTQSLIEMFQNYSADNEQIAQSSNVVIVDIGSETSRAKIAHTLSVIDSLEPLAVGVDVIFARPNDAQADSALKQALTEMASPMVMASVMDDGKTQQVKSFFADSLQLNSGSVMLEAEDNTVKSFKALQGSDTSFVALLNKFWNEEYDIKEKFSLKDEPISIDFNHDCAVVPADSVAMHEDDIAGRIVLVGDATTGSDMKRIPARKGVMPGVMVHAMSLETLHNMDGYPSHMSLLCNLLIAFVFCYVLELLLSLIQTKLPNTRKPWAMFLKEWVKNSYLTNIVLVPVLAVATIFMMNASVHGRYYQLTLIFTAVVLVVEARNIYRAAIPALRVKHNWAFLRNSLIP